MLSNRMYADEGEAWSSALVKESSSFMSSVIKEFLPDKSGFPRVTATKVFASIAWMITATFLVCNGVIFASTPKQYHPKSVFALTSLAVFLGTSALLTIFTITYYAFRTPTKEKVTKKVEKASEKNEEVRAPVETPPFSVAALKKAIPAHCFERSYVKSFLYLTVNLSITVALFYGSTFLFDLPWGLQVAAWPLYWVLQGCISTGIWVIAHECGHQAFSPSQLVNDTVGWILHSALLVPYFSWKYSHSRHHSKTGNMQYDEVFVPLTKEEAKQMPKFLFTSQFICVVRLVTMCLIGWPAYLLFNSSGRKLDRPANHFNPYAPIFRQSEAFTVFLSDVGLSIVICTLGYLVYAKSLVWVLCTYFLPYLIVNFWLVSITELQHTDRKLPHYNDDQWTWLKGALCTVDRDFGFLNIVFHHIGDTHVAHHLFSKIPHYHALEATEAIKPILKQYYLKDDTPIMTSLYKSFVECIYVEEEPSSHALWFKSASEIATTSPNASKKSQ